MLKRLPGACFRGIFIVNQWNGVVVFESFPIYRGSVPESIWAWRVGGDVANSERAGNLRLGTHDGLVVLVRLKTGCQVLDDGVVVRGIMSTF